MRKERVWQHDQFWQDSRGIRRNSLLNSHLNRIKLEILDHGYFVGNEQWNQFDVMSPFGRVYYMIDDEGWLETTAGRLDLTPGHMYLIPPYAQVNLRTSGRIEKFYFHFSLKYAGIEILEGINQCLSLSLDEDFLSKLIELFEGDEITDLLLFKSLAYDSLARFIRFGFPDLEHRIELTDNYQDVFTYIEEHLSAKLSGKDVCEGLGYAYETMRRRFRDDNGITLNQYISGRLIQSAAMRLLMTDLTIQQIAAELGFTDEFYFSRLFKKKMEYSPREYRRINAAARYPTDS